MKTNRILYAVMVALCMLMVSCDKVSPTGVLLGGSGTDDRVKMSYYYYQEHRQEYVEGFETDDYSFLVGSDSHVQNDTNRMAEMLRSGLENDDLLYAHLGDIADTKAEYYINLDNVIKSYKEKYVEKYYTYDPVTEKYIADEDTTYKVTYDDIVFPFYPVVGNHDITHNGWALFSSLFHSSFYQIYVYLPQGTDTIADRYIFLDSANGTLGDYQVDLLESESFTPRYNASVRHTFVFTHTNLFRPSSLQFSSTYPREELYYLLNKMVEWNTTIMFCGHVHAWDDREFGGVRYLTLDAMSESNNPDPGDYLVRVHCKADGTVSYERVHMSYTPNK